MSPKGSVHAKTQKCFDTVIWRAPEQGTPKCVSGRLISIVSSVIYLEQHSGAEFPKWIRQLRGVFSQGLPQRIQHGFILWIVRKVHLFKGIGL